MRPTHGLVPRGGALLISRTLDKVGPLARTADDCATVLATISGRFQPLETARPARIAFLEDERDEWAPHCRAALTRGVQELRGVAPDCVPNTLRRDLPYAATLETIMLAENAFELGAYIERPDFRLVDPEQEAELRRALHLPARAYLEALRARDAIVAEFARVFGEADAILTASRTTSMSDMLRAGANVAGLPGVSFPCGLAEDGLPVGLQLIGPRSSDALLLAIAGAYQRTTPHHLLRPR